MKFLVTSLFWMGLIGLVGSAVMLVRDWMAPTSEQVAISFEFNRECPGDVEQSLVCVVDNANASDIRIVGLNWC